MGWYKGKEQLGGKGDKKCVQGEKEVRKIILRKCEKADKIVHDSTGVKESSIVSSRSIHCVMAKGQPRRTWFYQAGSWRGKQRKKWLLSFSSAPLRLMYRCTCFLCV
jgi:hypothetical protein